MTMQFRTLTLHNVGVYARRQTIVLTPQPGRPVVLIGGLNGCGKTTLLDSLQLCLYGNRARCAGRGALSYEDYLRGLIARSAPPEDGASIDLSFTVLVDAEERTYRVVRSWKQAGRAVREFVTVFVNGALAPALGGTWADHVEDLLPLELAGLFLFDGEKVKDLADPATAAAVIRTAITSLLGVGALDQLRADLTALRRRQQPPDEDPELRGRIDHLLGRLQQLDNDRGTLQQKHAEALGRRHQAQAGLEEASRAFAAAGGDLYAKHAELQLQQQAHQQDLRAAADQLTALAEGPLPLALLHGTTRRLHEHADRSAASATAESVLATVAQRDAWILEQLPPLHADELRIRLQADRTRLAEQARYDGPPLDPALAVRLTILADTLREEAKRADAGVEEHRAITDRLAAAERALAMVPAEDRLAEPLQARQAAELELARVDGQLALIEQDLADVARLRAETESQLAAAEAERREHLAAGDYIRRVIDSIERVRSTLAQLKTRQVEAHVHKVEVAALDSFDRLMRKKGLVADLAIDPTTFEMSLRDRRGTPIRPGSLSAGESQILAISLLWGLARVAGRAMPMVVDTPLGRLDSGNRRLLVQRYFPNAGKQVLLLSTDEEIDADLHRLLAPAIARDYLLEHDDDRGATTIRDGYWWTQERRPA
jgi:DNA sulfur modification protein DndD